MEFLRDEDINKVEAEHQGRNNKDISDKRLIWLHVIGENREYLRYFRYV